MAEGQMIRVYFSGGPHDGSVETLSADTSFYLSGSNGSLYGPTGKALNEWRKNGLVTIQVWEEIQSEIQVSDPISIYRSNPPLPKQSAQDTRKRRQCSA